MAQTIYERLKAIGAEMDSHESDLYVVVTPESRAVVDTYEHRANVTTFDPGDGLMRYDIPFAYDPWWRRIPAIT